MNDDLDNPLASVDLHAWRVPPAPGMDAAALLSRALSPAASTGRPRARWIYAALVACNVVLLALVAVLLLRPAPRPVAVLPAGGAAPAPSPTALLERLEAQRRDLEAKLSEIDSIRATVVDLTARLERCETSTTHDSTIPRPHEVAPPAPVPAPEPVTADTSCDEVMCVLNNYAGTCCLKYKKPEPDLKAALAPDALDRNMISRGIASVRSAVLACGATHSTKGVVKVRVRVAADGRATNVEVTKTPDARLGGCVAGAVIKATFPATQQGGSFSYPFVF